MKRLFSDGIFDIFNYLPPVKDYFFVESVRGGLEAFIDFAWAEKTGIVMLPVFVAEGVIAPFRKKNIPIIFYRLNTDLSPNSEDIEAKTSIAPEIMGIVVIHYFGFAQNLAPIKRLCQTRQILLFEDCVHALFSKDLNGNYLGVTGDVSFFSFPKILPVPDGGIFFINNPDLVHLKNKIKYKRNLTGIIMVKVHLIYLLIKNIEVGLNYSVLFKLLNSITKILYFIYYFILQRIHKPQRISKQTLKILKTIDYEALIAARKENIKMIYEVLDRWNLLLLHKKYDPNWVLVGVPIVMREANRLASFLLKHNIECLMYTKSWFFMPRGRQHEFAFECELHHNHCLLPVHEDNEDFTVRLRELLEEKLMNPGGVLKKKEKQHDIGPK